MSSLSEAQIAEFKEAFSLFDQDADGQISNNDIGSVIRSLGQNISQRELKDLIKEVDTTKKGSVDFPEFLTMMTPQGAERIPTPNAIVHQIISMENAQLVMPLRFGDACIPPTTNDNQFMDLDTDLPPPQARKLKDGDNATDIKAAFRMFDPQGTGYISAQELKHVLTSMGEKLTREEVDETIRDAGVDAQGRIQMDDFMRVMLAK
ncbi:hypothetical protein HDU99_000059 [Rhizoclosmatium hyalinum]|nr:hypothetical protein HDU99_000059 [Rhizoclosmatium hyalinum]